MKTKSKTVKVPVNAGMPFNSNSYRLMNVGYDIFKHKYICHPDGDEQLIESVKVKRVFYDKPQPINGKL